MKLRVEIILIALLFLAVISISGITSEDDETGNKEINSNDKIN